MHNGTHEIMDNYKTQTNFNIKLSKLGKYFLLRVKHQ